MAKVLIHYTSEGIPVGIWRVGSNDGLQSFYPGNNSKWAERVKVILDDRDPGIDLNEFFDYLANHSSYSDFFRTVETQDNSSLDTVWYYIKNK